MNPPHHQNDPEEDYVFTCDLCQRAVFESLSGLREHVDTRHANVFPERNELLQATQEIRSKVPEIRVARAAQWQAWGEHTFALAARRDAGAQRLAEACAARAQLELVVQQWKKEAKVYIFGSSVAMGLWDGLSDIDFTVVDPVALAKGDWPPNEKSAVRGVAHHLRRCGFQHQNLEPIETARVPIIKHNASIPILPVTREEWEKVLARTARFLLARPAEGESQAAFEAAVRAKIPVESMWWTPDARVVSITSKNNSLETLQLLLDPPVGIKGIEIERGAPLHDEYRPELYRLDFDLSFRVFGVRNSRLLRDYLCAHPCGRPGALVLKDWSKTNGVNNSHQGYLTSYAINILWIFFLVQKNHVPFIDPNSIPEHLTAENADPVYRPLIPTELSESPDGRQRRHQQMGEMLFDFFAFYTTEFDWESEVVSLNRPSKTTKELLAWTLQDECRLTRQSNKSFRYTLCIEDPYEDNLNLGRHMGECRWRKFIGEMQRALVSLVKDLPQQSCVFPASLLSERDQAQDPPIDAITTLMAIAVREVESAEALVPSSHLQGVFRRECPTQMADVLKHWTWSKLIRRLGYKLVGDNIQPCRTVGASTVATSPKSIGTLSVPWTERLLEEVVRHEEQRGEHYIAPEWAAAWAPPQRSTQSIGSGHNPHRSSAIHGNNSSNNNANNNTQPTPEYTKVIARRHALTASPFAGFTFSHHHNRFSIHPFYHGTQFRAFGTLTSAPRNMNYKHIMHSVLRRLK